LVTLFSPESPLMRGLSRLADIMILNLLFIVTALPIVTLGAALTALNFTALRIGNGECNAVTGDYLRSFRGDFRQGNVIFLLLAGFTAVLAAWYTLLPTLPFGATVSFGLLIVWYVLAFTFATTAIFVFPYLAQFDGSTREVLRNARLLSWKHPLTALGALALSGLSVAITLVVPAAIGYGLFWLLFGFAGIAVANGFLFNRIFRQLIATATEH
jgi:uncharacterized membrane protein YesL